MALGRIIIVGGGIGGLTCAVALARRGLHAEVFEAAPALGAVGAGIWLPPNALQVMDRLGLAEALTAAGLPLERIELCDRARHLQVVDMARVVERFGHTTVSILRAELQRILVDAVGERLRLGRRCTGVEVHGEGATVRFEDGGAEQADLVIGADGIRSVVREAITPGVALRYAGQTCYRGVADLVLPQELHRTCRETWGGRARFGFSGVGPARVYWFAPVADEPGGRDQGGARPVLAQLYADFPAPIQDIIRSTPEASIARLDLYDFAPPIDRWWRGPLVVIGDAAHATTPNLGQGGAQAIEDAHVLAGCLAGAGAGDRAQALAQFQHLRQRKARQVVDVSWRLGRVAHYRSGVARTLRNLVLRATPDRIAARQIDSLYRIDEPPNESNAPRAG